VKDRLTGHSNIEGTEVVVFDPLIGSLVMGRWDGGQLSEQQAELARTWLGAPSLIADLSWGQMDTKVLHVSTRDRTVIVKAAGPDNHHIGREITAHKSYTSPLVARGRAGRLLHSNRQLNLLVLEYLEGELVEGTGEELAESAHAQAGELLKLLHGQENRIDDQYEFRVTAKSLAWLDRKHQIDPEVEREARQRLIEYRPLPIELVPTHGDWQPRNWISENGELRAIDFGRFDFRPAATDLCRLAVQQWQKYPMLEAAFLGEYGGEPRTEVVWRMDLLREAIGTAVWAHLVGDELFEAQGHQMLSQSLQHF
jgi:thiamine kinase-like enzyme